MNHLKDLYDTNDVSFIQDLFSKSVLVTEKIDGARFAFERNGDEILYYKRDASKPISLIDRTLMKYYEPAIDFVEKIPLSKIPDGVRFGFEYFATTNPGAISYDKIPKNGLIITDITRGGMMITDVDEVTKWANKLNVAPPPVIFKGKLSSQQKDKLSNFLSTEWEGLFSKFKTESFTAYIISILNPSLKNMALHIGVSKPIEGIVFSFNDGGTTINAKVVDPLFTQNARTKAKGKFTDEKKVEEANNKEFLRDFLSFVKKTNLRSITLDQDHFEKRYIELVSKVFHMYYKKNKSKFKNLSETDMLKISEMLDVNYRFIFDKDLMKLLKSNKQVKNGFKVVLGAFGKTRKRGNKIIDKTMLSDINSLIPKLQKMSESVDYQDKILTEIMNKLK